jgi:hypothetical protein
MPQYSTPPTKRSRNQRGSCLQTHSCNDINHSEKLYKEPYGMHWRKAGCIETYPLWTLRP